MSDEDLGTELLRIQNHTLEDGRVRGEIVRQKVSEGVVSISRGSPESATLR